MSKEKPCDGAKGAELGCRCGSVLFKVICWCGGHVDISCCACGSVIDHSQVIVEHTVNVHKEGVTCPECKPPSKIVLPSNLPRLN